MTPEERKDLCLLLLESLDDDDLIAVSFFTDPWERMAKLRDKINGELLRQLNRLKSHIADNATLTR